MFPENRASVSNLVQGGGNPAPSAVHSQYNTPSSNPQKNSVFRSVDTPAKETTRSATRCNSFAGTILRLRLAGFLSFQTPKTLSYCAKVAYLVHVFRSSIPWYRPYGTSWGSGVLALPHLLLFLSRFHAQTNRPLARSGKGCDAF
jgi:hypothetical protein